jgi:large subunit ribosomal protein L35
MKAKTLSSAKKRVKITGTGKFVLTHAGKRHLLSDKSKKAKGRNKYGFEAQGANQKQLKRCLPNGL